MNFIEHLQGIKDIELVHEMRRHEINKTESKSIYIQFGDFSPSENLKNGMRHHHGLVVDLITTLFYMPPEATLIPMNDLNGNKGALITLATGDLLNRVIEAFSVNQDSASEK